jgi:hypothetical protein
LLSNSGSCGREARISPKLIEQINGRSSTEPSGFSYQGLACLGQVAIFSEGSKEMPNILDLGFFNVVRQYEFRGLLQYKTL